MHLKRNKANNRHQASGCNLTSNNSTIAPSLSLCFVPGCSAFQSRYHRRPHLSYLSFEGGRRNSLPRGEDDPRQTPDGGEGCERSTLGWRWASSPSQLSPHESKRLERWKQDFQPQVESGTEAYIQRPICNAIWIQQWLQVKWGRWDVSVLNRPSPRFCPRGDKVTFNLKKKKKKNNSLVQVNVTSGLSDSPQW